MSFGSVASDCPTSAEANSRPSIKRPHRKKLVLDDLAKRFQEQFRVAERNAGGSLSKIIRRFDKDRSGALTADEFKRLCRVEFRITKDAISDKDIDLFVEALDDDGTGSLSTEEIMDFIERGGATFFSGLEDAHANSPNSDAGGATATGARRASPPSAIDAASYSGASACDHSAFYESGPFGILHSPSNSDHNTAAPAPLAYISAISPDLYWILLHESGYGPSALPTAKKASLTNSTVPAIQASDNEPTIQASDSKRRLSQKKRGGMLSFEAARRLQGLFKSATYNQSTVKLLKKFDKDRSGSFDADEFKRLVRTKLRIPMETMSDEDINCLLLALDKDASGVVSIVEIAEFVEKGPSYFTQEKEEPNDPEDDHNQASDEVSGSTSGAGLNPGAVAGRRPSRDIRQMGNPVSASQSLGGALSRALPKNRTAQPTADEKIVEDPKRRGADKGSGSFGKVKTSEGTGKSRASRSGSSEKRRASAETMDPKTASASATMGAKTSSTSVTSATRSDGATGADDADEGGLVEQHEAPLSPSRARGFERQNTRDFSSFHVTSARSSKHSDSETDWYEQLLFPSLAAENCSLICTPGKRPAPRPRSARTVEISGSRGVAGGIVAKALEVFTVAEDGQSTVAKQRPLTSTSRSLPPLYGRLLAAARDRKATPRRRPLHDVS